MQSHSQTGAAGGEGTPAAAETGHGQIVAFIRARRKETGQQAAEDGRPTACEARRAVRRHRGRTGAARRRRPPHLLAPRQRGRGPGGSGVVVPDQPSGNQILLRRAMKGLPSAVRHRAESGRWGVRDASVVRRGRAREEGVDAAVLLRAPTASRRHAVPTPSILGRCRSMSGITRCGMPRLQHRAAHGIASGVRSDPAHAVCHDRSPDACAVEVGSR